MQESNPFFYGNPVPSEQFIDRKRELRHIVGRFINQGQSTAIVGEPRSGKTSLLLYLYGPETRKELYGAEDKHLFFSFLDAQTFSGQFSQAQFWEQALHPLYRSVIAPKPESLLAQAYKTCQDNNFGAFVLERLFTQVGAEEWRLVLLLDEFNDLLHHPILNSAEFFGSLRSLASRSRGALALVIASRHSLTSLNEATRQFSRGGSPYFNFLDEVTLGPLPEKAVAELLERAGDRFSGDDYRFIAWAAGGHPYLLQAAASALWDAYEDGEDDPDSRRQQAGQTLYNKAAGTLCDTWRIWPPVTRRAFAAVAMDTFPALLEQCEFYVERLTRDYRDLGPEMLALTKQGFVAEDSNIPGGWRVRPSAFVWWVADELVRAVRGQEPFESWLRMQEMEGLFTKGEKQRMEKAARAMGGLLKDVVMAFIQGAAKGSGAAIAKSK